MTVRSFRLDGPLYDSVQGQSNVEITITTDTDTWNMNGQTSVGRELVIPCRYAGKVNAYHKNAEFLDADVCVLQVVGSFGVYAVGSPISFLTSFIRQGTEHFELQAPIQDMDLDRFENVRAGHDLPLTLRLSALLKVISKNQPHRREIVPVESPNGYQINVPRDRWVSLLQQAGVTRCVVEIPGLQSPQNHQQWDIVTRIYNEAIEHHRQGQFADSIGRCRMVMEGIVKTLGQQWDVVVDDNQGRLQSDRNWQKELAGRFKEVLGDEDTAELLGTLIASVKAWSNPMHHYNSKIPIREESAFSLHLTSNLLTYAALLLNGRAPQP